MDSPAGYGVQVVVDGREAAGRAGAAGARWPLPAGGTARQRRHGGGVGGHGRGAGPPGRGEDAGRPARRRIRSRVRRIRDEARAAATLSHPNIAQVYDYGEAERGRPAGPVRGDGAGPRAEPRSSAWPPGRAAAGRVPDLRRGRRRAGRRARRRAWSTATSSPPT